MTGTWTALRTELYKARHSPGSRLVLLATALIGAARVGGGFLADRFAQARRMTSSLAAGSTVQVSATDKANAYAPFIDGLTTSLTVGVLLVLAFAAATIASERDHGTIRLPLTRSVSRTGLLTAKAMSILLWALALALAAYLGAFVMAALLYRFGPIVDSNYEIFSAREINVELAKASLALLPPLFATAAFGVLISCVARTSGEAIGIALVSYVMFDLFKGLVGDGNRFVFATFNPAIVDRSYLHEVGQLARGFSTAGFAEPMLALNVVVPLVEGLVFLVLAGAIFARRRL
jgi:ABC-type transport system involved in multi-copper enzyme maturation permease subunit